VHFEAGLKHSHTVNEGLESGRCRSSFSLSFKFFFFFFLVGDIETDSTARKE
jgi:hypothetical protein